MGDYNNNKKCVKKFVKNFIKLKDRKGFFLNTPIN